MRLITVLSVIVFCIGCESEPEKGTGAPMYNLSTAEYEAAITAGCQRGKRIAAGTCSEGGPCPMVEFSKELQNISDALYYACKRNTPRMAFDTDDTAFNMGQTAKDACELYMHMYLLVIRGYSVKRARVASTILCEYDVSFRQNK